MYWFLLNCKNVSFPACSNRDFLQFHQLPRSKPRGSNYKSNFSCNYNYFVMKINFSGKFLRGVVKRFLFSLRNSCHLNLMLLSKRRVLNAQVGGKRLADKICNRMAFSVAGELSSRMRHWQTQKHRWVDLDVFLPSSFWCSWNYLYEIVKWRKWIVLWKTAQLLASINRRNKDKSIFIKDRLGVTYSMTLFTARP